ncbi:50S ribosomal protein L11 methyltransferase [Mesorhizobium sp. RP14(2022)]|uniref:Ribosomal protein L11 methyltransferase n=1 Tax=Mesorhizobium liriopis TaxID=2953882 RepID=A0ABT1C774_9HYPH|nr:50S ribosomal protein L11 methyltransferase [Mesorhizobium liriopis]MCO6050011.1 50S ribosomal protein L11 methyltransferase [Mesorhizobium liriopis]
MGAHRLTIILPKETAKRAYDALDFAFEDEGLPLSYREVEEDGPLIELSVYVEDEWEPTRATIEVVLSEQGLEAEVEHEQLPDIDWVTRSLEGLKPVRAGRFLVHGAHDRDKRRAGDIAIEIEAGLAFGTGHHGTTAGCLEMLHRVAQAERPRNALDLGTGSAVLAIALARLSHIPVLATDIDPIATGVAAENAELNGVASFVHAVTAVGFEHTAVERGAPFDLIIANILARPLMRLAPDFATHVAPGGSVILSGILERQRAAVIAAFVGQRFRHVRTLWREGWVTIHLKR